MKITDVTNWAYLRLYAPGAANNWQTISQEEAKKKSNKFIRQVVNASKGMTMDKNEMEPATDAEIAEWVEQRRVAAQADYDELTETLKRMRQMAAHNYPGKKDVKE